MESVETTLLTVKGKGELRCIGINATTVTARMRHMRHKRNVDKMEGSGNSRRLRPDAAQDTRPKIPIIGSPTEKYHASHHARETEAAPS